MNKQTTELAFESYVEEVLLNQSGWQLGTNSEWDKKIALFPQRVFSFVEATPFELWNSVRTLHGDGELLPNHSAARSRFGKTVQLREVVLTLLPTGRDSNAVSIGNDAGLEYYRLTCAWSGAISLREGEEVYVKNPTDVGTGRAKEVEAPLSELTTTLNDRFGTEFSEDERYFAMQFCERAAKDDRVVKTPNANSLDKFQLDIKDVLAGFMIDAMSDNGLRRVRGTG